MRNFLKNILQSWLKIIARQIVKKYKPRVIAVTGSFGKTTTKEAIYEALKPSLLSLRKNYASLNSELGVPLTIVGGKDPKGSVLRWLSVLVSGVKQIILANKFYPRNLVLEMGADKPGDIDYLLSIAKPQVAVLTGIGHTHLEYFESVDKVAEEKIKLIKALPHDGVAVFNNDNPLIREFISQPEVNYLTYGLQEDSHVKASQIREELNDLAEESATATSSDHVGGVGFKVSFQDKSYQSYLHNVVGFTHINSSLAAIAVAIGLGLDLEKSVEGLKQYQGSPGRMRLIPCVKRTFIIDDSYNSSPEAAIAALEILASIEIRGLRWAVLGDMLELGAQTEDLHAQVGQRVAELNIDYLITTGDPAHFIGHGAKVAGMPEDRIFEFQDKEEAGRFLQSKIKTGDLILIKGSRGIHQETNGTRMEKIVKEVMAQPQKADELLYFTR